MTELSVVPLSSVILALTLAVDGYNKVKDSEDQTASKNNFMTVIVTLALFLIVAVIAIIFKPTSPGARMLFSAASVILLLIALIVSWLNYVNNTGGPLGAQTLVIAIVTAIPLLATLVTKDTFTLKIDL